MQTLYVPKYGITYRVNQKNPRELLWSKKPFGPATQWQHAYTFSKPIRALDTDDQTGQGVVVLNDSTTYVGSGVRVWGKKFYTAGSRIYSLYAIGESKMKTQTETIDVYGYPATVFAHTKDLDGTDTYCAFFRVPDRETMLKVKRSLKKDGASTVTSTMEPYTYKIQFIARAGTKFENIKVESKMKIRIHEAQEFHKVAASGLNYDDACFVQEEMQEFANNNGYAAKIRVHNDGSDNFSIVIKSTDENDLTRLPDDFDLDSVIAELQRPSVHKELDKRDLSHTFSDNYIDREVNFIKGRPWDKNESNRFCDKLDAYIAAIDEDDNGNDILYIKNDEDGFEITVTIKYGIDNDADRVVDAEWKRT